MLIVSLPCACEKDSFWMVTVFSDCKFFKFKLFTFLKQPSPNVRVLSAGTFSTTKEFALAKTWVSKERVVRAGQAFTVKELVSGKASDTKESVFRLLKLRRSKLDNFWKQLLPKVSVLISGKLSNVRVLNCVKEPEEKVMELNALQSLMTSDPSLREHRPCNGEKEASFPNPMSCTEEAEVKQSGEMLSMERELKPFSSNAVNCVKEPEEKVMELNALQSFNRKEPEPVEKEPALMENVLSADNCTRRTVVAGLKHPEPIRIVESPGLFSNSKDMKLGKALSGMTNDESVLQFLITKEPPREKVLFPKFSVLREVSSSNRKESRFEKVLSPRLTVERDEAFSTEKEWNSGNASEARESVVKEGQLRTRKDPDFSLKA